MTLVGLSDRFEVCMSAEIIQFVPKPNPNREAPLCNALDAPEFGGVVGCKYWNRPDDTAPCEYVAPRDDCA